MRANIKIKFINPVPDPGVHYTLDQVYQVLDLHDTPGVRYLIMNDINVIQGVQVDGVNFELVSIAVPGDDVQLYP